jgi:hypothetical protein
MSGHDTALLFTVSGDAGSIGASHCLAARAQNHSTGFLPAHECCCRDCAGFYIIPRSPTEVYYDVSTETVEAQLYNWFYCCNTTSNTNCPASAWV